MFSIMLKSKGGEMKKILNIGSACYTADTQYIIELSRNSIRVWIKR